MRRGDRRVIFVVASVLLGSIPAGAAGAGTGVAPAVPRSAIVSIAVPGNAFWTDTGVALVKGNQVSLTAAGTIQWSAGFPGTTVTPDGNGVVSPTDPYFCSSYGRSTWPFTLPGAHCWALIGRIGVNGTPFEIGSSRTFTAAQSGELFLGPNDNVVYDNGGAWQISLNADTATCVGSQPCFASAATTATATAPGLSVSVIGTAAFGNGSVSLSIKPGSLRCPNVPPSIAPIATLTDTGFSPSDRLSVTAVLPLTSATSAEQVCFESSVPFRSQTSPVVPLAGTALLLKCTVVADVPPCVTSSKQVGRNVVVDFVVPGADPRFYIVLPKGRQVWLSQFATGKVGTAYHAQFQTSGGRAPIHWSIASGKLPAGCTLNADTGVISGKPTKKGTYPVSVRATDGEKPPKTAQISIPITIA